MFENRKNTEMASEEKPIGLRTRPDLVIQQSVFQGEQCWIVKDPLAMKFFRLHEAEYRIFEALRGKISYRELKTQLMSVFPDKVIRLETIQNLVVSLHRGGLLISDAPGQAAPLERQAAKERNQKLIGLVSSIASPRFPGIDPAPILNFLYPKLRWIYTSWFTCIAIAVSLSAVLLLLSNLEEFYSRLPGFHQFFAFDNLLMMSVILILTKSIHELGHGLMCKHFGGECQEIGFMLLLMTPAMYCNTSDSWVLPNRWHRISVGAGGMYVEILLSSLCTFVWWYTNPGWLHYLSLNVMFLCSVSTIVFNANPLLRLDGYYILSDFLEIPNLNQKSKQLLVSSLKEYCMGMPTSKNRFMPRQHRLSFIAFSIASACYRWIVFVGIYLFLRKVLEPQGLISLANVFAGVSLIGMMIVPLFRSVRFFMFPGRVGEMRQKNAFTTAFCLTALVCVLLFAPVPDRIIAPARISPRNLQAVMVDEPGLLRSILVKPGQHVKEGDVIALLENTYLEQECMALQGELASLQSDLSGYLGNQSRLIDSERLVVETKVAIKSCESKILTKKHQLERLVIRSDRDGIVVSPINVPVKPLDEFELPQWTGTPLEEKNLGAYLARNTLICLVAPPSQFQAVLLVDQSDVQLIRQRQQVKLMLRQTLGQKYFGEVVAVSQDELTSVPVELSQAHGGDVAVRPVNAGQEEPIFKMFEVSVDLCFQDKSEMNWLASGHSGLAVVHVGWSPLATIAARYIKNTINFR